MASIIINNPHLSHVLLESKAVNHFERTCIQIYLYFCLSTLMILMPNMASALLSDTLGYPPRIMALGDSITAGCCDPRVGYYQFLANDLTIAGHVFSMVGSKYLGGYQVEAHPGAWPYDLLNGILDSNTGLRTGGVTEWMIQSAPDIVLLHAGTNGVGSSGSLNYDPQVAQWGKHVEDMRKILDAIFNINPSAYVILAKIINKRTYNQNISEFNRQLELMASLYENSHLYIVDMEFILSSNTIDNYVDSVHPSPSGLSLMSDTWYPVLENILNQDPKKGDITGDGVIDVRDLLQCTRIVLGLDDSPYEISCDVAPLDVSGEPHGNNLLNAGDISVLQQIVIEQ